MNRAVLLDALGTLLELEDPTPAIVSGLAGHGVAVTAGEARCAVRAEIAYYRAHHDEGSDPTALAALRRRCAAVLVAALPAPARDLEPDAIHDTLMGALRFRPYPEVPEALRRLRASGRRLVVVSNWDISLHDQLAATGIGELVDAAVSSAEVGAGKPRAPLFHRALELAGCAPAEALMVGDSPDTDVAGALAAGIGAVLVDREGGHAAGAEVPVIRSLAELPRLVESLP